MGMGGPPPGGVTPAGSEKGRHAFMHKGRRIYEWEQTLDEIHLFVKPPPGIKASMLDCKITPSHLRLGIKGNPPFIDEDFTSKVLVEESYWMMEDGELHIDCQKASKGETWESALKGHAALDPFTRTEVQKKMMLERFQQEHPGFDFSGAEFSGNVPDPKAFMGGVPYQ